MKRVLFMFGSMILGATAVQAHTHLESSVPADKSKVPTPSVIELQFSEAARVTALTVQKGEAAAKNLGPLPAKAANRVSVPVTGLTAGSYTATWRVVGADGHVMSGKFQFTVDPAAPAVTPKAGEKMHMEDHQDMSSHMEKKSAPAASETHQH